MLFKVLLHFLIWTCCQKQWRDDCCPHWGQQWLLPSLSATSVAYPHWARQLERDSWPSLSATAWQTAIKAINDHQTNICESTLQIFDTPSKTTDVVDNTVVEKVFNTHCCNISSRTKYCFLLILNMSHEFWFSNILLISNSFAWALIQATTLFTGFIRSAEVSQLFLLQLSRQLTIPK